MGDGGFSLVARHTVIERPEFLFEIDEYKRGSDQQLLLIHLRVHRWSPSTFKLMKRTWHSFRQHVSAPIYGYPTDKDDALWEKFVTRVGFRPTGLHITCNNGAQRRLFIHVQDDADHGLIQGNTDI